MVVNAGGIQALVQAYAKMQKESVKCVGSCNYVLPLLRLTADEFIAPETESHIFSQYP